MTVSYTADVANGGKFVSFWRVLMRWRGSLYKLIWQDLLCYCVLFVIINLIHKHALPKSTQLMLEQVKGYLSSNLGMFPISFGLNFFVDQVAKKWWHQYQLLPSPDTLAIYTNAAIPGKDEKSRMIRRTIVRYAVLSLVLTLRNISIRVKKRFPTIKHVAEAGFLVEDEKMHYERLESQAAANNWMPLAWAANVATHAKTLNKVTSDHCLRLLITELSQHRDKLGTLVSYDLVNIPLVYTQTMIVLVTGYAFIVLISTPQQPLTLTDTGNNSLISNLANLIIYIGLMKVATVMLNPFGEDDDDFELNAIVDRHLKAGYIIVDEMHEEEPDVVKDAYWDEIVPAELPYTVGSMGLKEDGPDCFREDEEAKPLKRRFSFFRGGSAAPSKVTTKTRGKHVASNYNGAGASSNDYYSDDSEDKYENIAEIQIHRNPDPSSVMYQVTPQQPRSSNVYYNRRQRY